jgi:hypothetical protein
MADPTEKQFVFPGWAMTHHLAWIILPLLVVGCGEGSESPTAASGVAPPPAQASVLWVHGTSLMRSETDGSGQVTLADEPAMIGKVVVSGVTVAYEVPQNTSNIGNVPRDTWVVRTDGTDRHLVLRSAVPQWLYLVDVIGSWVLYTDRTGPEYSPPPPSLASILVNGTAPRTLSAAVGSGELWQAPSYERQIMGRAVFDFAGNYFSVLPDGSELRQLTVFPPFPHLNNETFTSLLGIRGVVGNAAIYATVQSPSSPVSAEGTPKLFAVPVVGGPVAKLGSGPDMEIFGVVVGSLVVYQQCVPRQLPNFDITLDRCDLMSVQGNGQGRIALTSTSEINYVQGSIGSQIIIRRSRSGGTPDNLVSVPVGGGKETPLLDLNPNNEFVSAIVADRILLRRPTGLWSLQADGGGLVQLTTNGSDWFSGAADDFACFDRSGALWCVPADGSGPATQVTANGRFVVGL